MSPATPVAAISSRFVQLFATIASEDIGTDKLPLVLAEMNLPQSAIREETLGHLDSRHAAIFYATFQQALRLYYGRGAWGILLRIGRKMWERMVAQANIREKAELDIARRLPVPARRRRVLDLVAERLGEGGGKASVHLLDIDLLLADHASAAASNQSSEKPICFVTLGLIQGALFWATGQEADVEEIACKAAGAPACEFKITFGGN